MSDIITRTFIVDRDGRKQEYIFQAKSSIFVDEDTDGKWNNFNFECDACGSTGNIKATEVTNTSRLKEFLRNVFLQGYPPRDGKLSVSSLPTKMLHTQINEEFVYSGIAGNAQYHGYAQHQHQIVENYFIKFFTESLVACEVPVWNDEVHGHIDILVMAENKVRILDFKPNAKAEKKAASQLWNYRELLAERTGIKKSDIECYYFDDIDCFKVLL